MTMQLQEINKKAELARMKLVATGLLVLVTIIYIVAVIFEARYPWVGFISATAEAAMVGALADWFAVTALFRHPLGLKIPHTAIIPYRKDAIADQFGNFVKTNFLATEVITSKLRSINAARLAANWISQPENSQLIAQQVAVGIAGVVQVMNDEDVQDMIERSLRARIQSTPVSPLLGHLLSLITSGQRKEELLSGAVKLGLHLLKENRDIIQEKIAQETPWWFPEPVDEAIYKKILTASQKTLQEVSSNPKHPASTTFWII